MQRVRFGWHYDFYEGPDGVAPGPDRAEWDAYVGSYEIKLLGNVLGVAEIRREDGHLYFDRYRLAEEYEPGLFFTVRGEALDLRGEIPTWRNIPLTKVED